MRQLTRELLDSTIRETRDSSQSVSPRSTTGTGLEVPVSSSAGSTPAEQHGTVHDPPLNVNGGAGDSIQTSDPSSVNLADVSNGNGGSGAGPSVSSGNIDAARALGVDPNHLQQLLDMGFPHSSAVEALVSTSDMVQATDYLLNNNPNTSNSNPPSSLSPARLRPRGIPQMPPLITGAELERRRRGDWVFVQVF